MYSNLKTNNFEKLHGGTTMEEKRKWIRKETYNKSMWFAYATMWVAVAVAVIAGMLITKSAWCLWAFILPANIEVKSKSDSKNDDDEDIDGFVDDLK